MRTWKNLAVMAVAMILGLGAMPGIDQTAYAATRRTQPQTYQYRGRAFGVLVADSFSSTNPKDAGQFYSWMDTAYNHSSAKFPGKPGLTLEQLLDSKRHYLAGIKDRKLRAQNEVAFSAWIHKMVKATIPKFSLDRGFEFANTIKFGERQCFLQSVLIAGMLQRAGVKAGVVMVYRNIVGEDSNNGHAVTLVKLADGQDLIVDASEPEPFPHHQGLFVRSGDYKFVVPIYAANSRRIAGYKPESDKTTIPVSNVKTMDYSFIRAQFYYYRGERAPGGILAANRTPAGLKESERQLQRSVALCPKNPLAVYMLGRVYLLEGNQSLARSTLHQAGALYERFGMLPAGPKEYIALADKSDTSSANRQR